MDGGESILDAIFDEDNLEDAQDVEMMEVEEGELVGQELHTESGQNVGGDVHPVSQEAGSKHRKRRNKKKKPRKKKGSSGTGVVDINRFVLDICKRLKERKTHLVYTAVGCLGVSALGDLVKEVDAIQACGGQKTADGKRFRNGGGILWNVLKARDPNAYKEIMKKTKEFEKQFGLQMRGRRLVQNKEAASENLHPESTNESSSDGAAHVENQCKQSNAEENRASVHDRIRVPVKYDDLLEEEGQNEQPT